MKGLQGRDLQGGFKGLEGGFKGVSRGFQGSFKGASRDLQATFKVKRASRGLKGARRGLEGGLKGARSGLEGGLKGASSLQTFSPPLPPRTPSRPLEGYLRRGGCSEPAPIILRDMAVTDRASALKPPSMSHSLLGTLVEQVVLVAQLVSRHSCVADRLPVVVRFPAGPRVRLKTVDPLKGNRLGQKKGIVVEQYGDRLLDDSLMAVGWPLHLDGAVKQWCVHRTATFQELTSLLKTYDTGEDHLLESKKPMCLRPRK